MSCKPDPRSVLSPSSKARLSRRLVGNKIGDTSGGGLPKDRRRGDKTGSGDRAAANGVASSGRPVRRH